MYLEHFQLQRQPFSEHTTVAALWQDARMDEGLARLEYLLDHGALGLVTGPSGVGKSALLKRFLHGRPPQQCEAIYCHLTHLPSAGILKLVLNQLGEIPRRGKDRIYAQILERAARTEGTLLLVFDEAHLLDADTLTDLRLLTKEQTTRYIDFQMTQAGGNGKFFDDSVKAAIHDFTGGVPRHINNLATACLLQATARKLARIDDDLFQQVVSEFQLP